MTGSAPDAHAPAPVLGLLLAAGAGSRMGIPKALLHDAGDSYLLAAVRALREGGCAAVAVVLGAEADRAAGILGGAVDPVDVVHAADWAEGMGASLRAGLAHAQGTEAVSALVTLVDLPDVEAAVTRRLLARLPHDTAALGRAAYDGVPGHPVLLGRDHWEGVMRTAEGDQGAREYLRTHPPVLVECGDLATGQDVDTPDQLR